MKLFALFTKNSIFTELALIRISFNVFFYEINTMVKGGVWIDSSVF